LDARLAERDCRLGRIPIVALAIVVSREEPGARGEVDRRHGEPRERERHDQHEDQRRSAAGPCLCSKLPTNGHGDLYGLVTAAACETAEKAGEQLTATTPY